MQRKLRRNWERRKLSFTKYVSGQMQLNKPLKPRKAEGFLAKVKKGLLPPAVAALMLLFPLNSASALPVDGDVKYGSANIKYNGLWGTWLFADKLTVTQNTAGVIIDWHAFDIYSNEAVYFKQLPYYVALNRVAQGTSNINGVLKADGHIFLINPNGVIFGQGAQVSVGGLVASTGTMSNAEFISGLSSGRYKFTVGNNSNAVLNYGNINTTDGGYVAFVASKVNNAGGTVKAPNGTVAFAAGDNATLTVNNNHLINVAVAKSSLGSGVVAQNEGTIQAGDVIMIAKASDVLKAVVNNHGIIEAKTVSSQGGTILLEGGLVTNTNKLDAGQGTITIHAADDVVLAKKDSQSGTPAPEIITGALNITSDAGMIQQQAGRIVATGETWLAAAENINLDQANNDFNVININKAKVASINDVNNVYLGNVANTNQLLLSAYNGMIGQKNGTQVSVGNADLTADNINLGNFSATLLDATAEAGHIGQQAGTAVVVGLGGANLSATGDITLSNAQNDFQGTVIAAGRNVSLADQNDITLGKTTAVQGLTVDAAGDITFTGDVSAGTMNATAGQSIQGSAAKFTVNSANVSAGQDVTLTNTANNFGSVTVARGNTVSLVDQNDITVSAGNTANLNVTANGDISTGAVAVTNQTNLDAQGSVNIIGHLQSGSLIANAQNGSIRQYPGSQVDVTGSAGLTAGNSITFRDFSAGDLIARATAGGISQGLGTRLVVAGDTTLSAQQDIVLNNSDNDFVGIVQVTGARNAELVDKNDLRLGLSSVRDSFTATARSGAGHTGKITVEGTIDVGGVVGPAMYQSSGGQAAFIADEMQLNASVNADTILVHQFTGGRQITLGTGETGLNLTNQDLNHLNAGQELRIGNTDSGDVTVDSRIQQGDKNITLTTGANLNMNAALNTTGRLIAQGSAGDNQFNIGSGNLDGFSSMEIRGGGGNDQLNLNDSVNTTGNTYAISATGVNRAATAASPELTIGFNQTGNSATDSMSRLSLTAGTGRDTVNTEFIAGVTQDLDGGLPSTYPGDTLNFKENGAIIWSIDSPFTARGTNFGDVAYRNFEKVTVSDGIVLQPVPEALREKHDAATLTAHRPNDSRLPIEESAVDLTVEGVKMPEKTGITGVSDGGNE